MIKEIVKNLNLSSTLRINEISKDLEAQGKDVFKFGFGQSPFKVPDEVVLELKNNANKNNYLPVQGLPKLREAIARLKFSAISPIASFGIKVISLDKSPSAISRET